MYGLENQIGGFKILMECGYAIGISEPLLGQQAHHLDKGQWKYVLASGCLGLDQMPQKFEICGNRNTFCLAMMCTLMIKNSEHP